MVLKNLIEALKQSKYVVKSGVVPLAQKLYIGGIDGCSSKKLEPILGENSDFPDIAIFLGTALASYKAGRAIDGSWPKYVRGSVQTLGSATLGAGAIALSAYMSGNDTPMNLADYANAMIESARTAYQAYSSGSIPPLMESIIYGNLVIGAGRWTMNLMGHALEKADQGRGN